MNNSRDRGKLHGLDSKWFDHLKRKLNSLHARYNPEIKMLRCPFSSPGYHTTIKQADFVHPVRETMDYALALLDGGDPTYRQRAFDIMGQVVSLQDPNPQSPTYGIWSWFWEEPLAKMAPPDWNWADFIGKRLLLVLIRHGDVLPSELSGLIRQAIGHSCEAIIKRNVGPDYTNIAIMGAFVTLIAGERLENSRYAEYGLARLKRLYDYTMQTGAFLEYNSPPYSTLAILELSALAVYTASEEARQITNELLEGTWQTIAEHYHPLLKQWSGPHARSYSSFLDPVRRSFLHAACRGEVPFISEEEFQYDTEWYGQGVACPERVLELFAELPGVRELRQDLPPNQAFSTRTAYTYMTPSYSLGTFNHNVMWNQCRNLLAYLDAGEQEQCYVRLRVLHDGYDFCSAVFKSNQKHGSVLYGIQFALDGGDTHVNLDPIHGRMTASDLRIRLETGCTGQAPSWERLGDEVYRTRIGQTALTVRGLYGGMSGLGPFRWETAAEGTASYLDLVVYEGEAAPIDFHAMEEALFCFALTLSEDTVLQPKASADSQPHTVRLMLQQAGAEEPLQLTLAKKPDTRAVLFQ
ncbi:hypothetical protein RAC89_09575 [Paenibacillus sp. GD4]|uniref:hypothetical protein n=1 Tax=Paenibacillus sp. GD4 TaxID=3068890 RepID=UPI002796C0ED|nr:hypothetical protein [Paenibacillus sp. GD4]MDQ1910722.1 hypothetical protein [Paenibacillus sp. GD4]